MRPWLPAMFLTAAVLVTPAAGRQIESWSYERLFKAADVVVIASAKQTTDSDDAAPDGLWSKSLVGRRTTFTVLSALKGRPDADTITVRHFKLATNLIVQNGPLLVTFRTKGRTIQGSGSDQYRVELPAPQYLLFLKAAPDGLLEPVSGQIDPVLSVKEIHAPLPDVTHQPHAADEKE